MNALILVDIQNDFLPGGALAVAEGDQILPVVNRILQHPFDLVVATKDWHPHDHHSFAATHKKVPGERIMLRGLEQILWPVHCVEGTKGAELSPHLDVSRVKKIFYKGTDKTIDSYSTFFDNGHFKSTGLETYLREKNIKNIFIAGLATDYCVKYSALDALKMGFNVFVIEDACRGVDLDKGDSQKAIEEMSNAGAVIIKSHDLHSMKVRGGGI